MEKIDNLYHVAPTLPAEYFQNKDGMVTAILSKQEFQALQSEMFIEETFSGSLPQFLTAFAGRKS